MFTGSDLSHAQRELIGNTIEIIHNTEADFIKKLERRAPTEMTNFRGRREPLEVRPNPSLSAYNPAGGILATPGAPGFDHLLIPYVSLNIGLETSYEAIMNAAGGHGAVSDPLEQISESTGRTFVKWLNIFASNSNGTMKIGIVSVRTSNSVLTLDGATDSIGATQILEGQRVKVFDPTGTTQRVGVVGAGTILVASRTNTTITRDASGIDWPSTVVADDIIVPEGSTPSVGFKGIPYIINNVGDYFGIARSTTDRIQSIITPAGGVGLTAAMLYNTNARRKQRTGQLSLAGTGVNELAMGMTQEAAYNGLIPAASFQHIGEARPAGDIGLSSQAYTWFGTPLNAYQDWLGNRIDFLNFEYLKIAALKEAGSMIGMPANDDLQSFDGATSNWRAAKAKFLDVSRDYFSTSPHRFAAVTGLGMAGLPMQKSTS